MPPTVNQKRRRSPNILRHIRQRRQNPSAPKGLGQKPAKLNGGIIPQLSFNKELISMKPNQNVHMLDSSSECSCRETTTSRRKDCRRLTAKEPEKFHTEIKEFSKNHKSPIGSESG